MRKSRASKLFYLAVFSLLGSSHAVSSSGGREPTKSKNAPPDVCNYEPGAIVSDACASYSTLEGLNEALAPHVRKITQETDFFSHYRLNLFNKKCPFWSDEDGMCGNIACAVNTLENEEDIPLVWRAHELGKLEGPHAKHPGKKVREEHRQKPLQGSLGEDVGESCVVEYDDECDDRDYCVPEDERADAKGDYVSLVDNPERFTGYAGPGAQQVWGAIYRENCFSKESAPAAAQMSAQAQSPFGGFSQPQKQAAQDLRNVLKEQGVQQGIQSAIAHKSGLARVDPVEFDDECLEKRVFHRIISGMHASISTHLCHDYLNQTTGQWGPNLSCFESRLANYPDRISNIYFNYALVLRAIGKIRGHIRDYTFCSVDPDQDQITKALVLKLAGAIQKGPDIFDETLMFNDPSAITLKEDFRNRFRNVSRIMDCVGCDKCRLWGKVQTAGYGTALKVLFEFDEANTQNDPPLRRTELVALVNTLDRLGHSLSAVKSFRKMIEARDGLTPLPDAAPSDIARDLDLESHTPAPPPKSHKSPHAHADADTKTRPSRKSSLFSSSPSGHTGPAPWEPSWQSQFHRPGESQWESAVAEARMVWATYVWVLRSWAELPRKFWYIALGEVGRGWDWYQGRMWGPRMWEWRGPNAGGREEL